MRHPTSSDEIDGHLLDRIGRGDRDAFERFYLQNVDYVRGRLCASFSLGNDLADVVQDVFLQVWQCASSYHPERGAPTAWLMVLARSRAIDLLRKRPRQPVPAGDADDRVAAPVHPAEALWLKRELEQLPEAMHFTVRLSFYEGFSHSQIARKLGRPLGTIKTNLRNCVRQMRASAAVRPPCLESTRAICS